MIGSSVRKLKSLKIKTQGKLLGKLLNSFSNEDQKPILKDYFSLNFSTLFKTIKDQIFKPKALLKTCC